MLYINQMIDVFGERVVFLKAREHTLNEWGDIEESSDVERVEVEGVVEHMTEDENDMDEGDVVSGDIEMYVNTDDVREELIRFGNHFTLPERNGQRYKITSVQYAPNPDRFPHAQIVGERI